MSTSYSSYGAIWRSADGNTTLLLSSVFGYQFSTSDGEPYLSVFTQAGAIGIHSPADVAELRALIDGHLATTWVETTTTA